jgi:hypothetical protein
MYTAFKILGSAEVIDASYTLSLVFLSEELGLEGTLQGALFIPPSRKAGG